MGIGSRLRTSLWPGRKRREIAEELRYHAERRAADGTAAAALGDLDRLQERTQSMDVFTWLESCWLDLRHAARMLRRAPGFTALVVLSLAIGIGANAAIFSLINAVLLRTLPVPRPEQIFLVSETNGQREMPVVSYAIFQRMQKSAGGHAQLAAYSDRSELTLSTAAANAAERVVEMQAVSSNYFAVLGLQPVLGRFLTPSDNRALGASPVAVISYNYWQRHFGGARSALGAKLSFRGGALTVVGVAPPGFIGLEPSMPADLWAPLMMQAALHFAPDNWSINSDRNLPWPSQEGELWLNVVARLPQPAQATAIAARLTPPVAASFKPLLNDGLAHRAVLAPGGRGRGEMRAAYGGPLRLLMALVALMLIIAVANVAALLLARMVRRRQELAIRVALGVSRIRLARQLLTEALLLAALAGAAAVGVAVALTRLLDDLAHANITNQLDWRVWVFLALVALAAGLVLGLLPAWQALRRSPGPQSSSAGAAGSVRGRALGTLVVVQIALSLLLVASAALCARSLAAMFTQPLGFNRTNLLTVRLRLPLDPIPAAQWPVIRQRLIQRVGALPGVSSVAVAQMGLDSGSANTSGIALAGRVSPPGGLESHEAAVTANYFSTVGMRLLRGRGFAPTDTATSRFVVVVNQAFARRFYPGQNPIGKTFGYSADETGQWEIVGIVADARVDDPHQPAVPLFYHLADQAPGKTTRALEIRTAGDPAALVAAVRRAIPESDARLALYSAHPIATTLDGLLSRDRLVAELSGGFGLLALALACLGLYGVMAFAAGARRAEFGVRMALGARRADVAGLVLRQAAALELLGLALGLPLALWAAHWLQPLLQGVSARDPATLAAAAILLALAPLLASLPPAWRAACADPVTVLRSGA